MHRTKQEFINVKITLFSEKKQGAFIRAGAFIRINTVGFQFSVSLLVPECFSVYVCHKIGVRPLL